MKRITQLVLLALGFSVVTILLSTIPYRHASAASSIPARSLRSSTAPVPIATVPALDDVDAPNHNSGSVAVGAIAAHLVGRIVIDPTGTAQWIGYLPYLAGITGNFFSGTPGEPTAYFTFRSTTFQEQAIPNGNLTELFPNAVVTPLQIHVYLNSDPDGNFQNPDTFSSGQLVATLEPERAMGTDTGTLTFAAGTYNVVSGSKFAFQGETYNIRELTRALTIVLTFGGAAPGLSDGTPVLVSSFGGYAIAVAGMDQDTERSRRGDR